MRYLKNTVVYCGQFSMYVVNQEGRKENDMFCLWEWMFIWLSSPFIKFYQGVIRYFLLVFYNQLWRNICKNIPAITYSLLFLYPEPFNYQFSIITKYNPNFLCFTCKQLKIIIKSIHFNGKLAVAEKKRSKKINVKMLSSFWKRSQILVLKLSKRFFQTHKC